MAGSAIPSYLNALLSLIYVTMALPHYGTTHYGTAHYGTAHYGTAHYGTTHLGYLNALLFLIYLFVAVFIMLSMFFAILGESQANVCLAHLPPPQP